MNLKEFLLKTQKEKRVSSGGSSEEKLYENKELDETGWIYFGSRYYNPGTRVFVQYDPSFLQIGAITPNIYDSQSLNPYSFERNNPYRYTDPTGMVNEEGVFLSSIGVVSGTITTVGGVTIITGGTATGVLAIPGYVGGGAMVAYGTAEASIGAKNFRSAWNDVPTEDLLGGPLEESGNLFFGETGRGVGKTADMGISLISLRGGIKNIESLGGFDSKKVANVERLNIFTNIASLVGNIGSSSSNRNNNLYTSGGSSSNNKKNNGGKLYTPIPERNTQNDKDSGCGTIMSCV